MKLFNPIERVRQLLSTEREYKILADEYKILTNEHYNLWLGIKEMKETWTEERDIEGTPDELAELCNAVVEELEDIVNPGANHEL